MSNSLTNDVAIIMGSDSDWPVMEEAAKALDSFGISYTADVVSAHRMPEEMVEFAKSAASKGYKVIIAGAGGAAHLPGMVASLTTLPVIGVPVSLKNLEGMDSLLSIVQMPGGIPVATVGIDNAKNAGILAARIIGSADVAVAKKIEAQLATLSEEAKAKGAQLSARRSTKTGF
jgi:5-(carboxyamino)imidazole ribonucleotide mutase